MVPNQRDGRGNQDPNCSLPRCQPVTTHPPIHAHAPNVHSADSVACPDLLLCPISPPSHSPDSGPLLAWEPREREEGRSVAGRAPGLSTIVWLPWHQSLPGPATKCRMTRSSRESRVGGTGGLDGVGEGEASSAEGLALPQPGSACENAAASWNGSRGGWQTAEGRDGGAHAGGVALRQMSDPRNQSVSLGLPNNLRSILFC